MPTMRSARVHGPGDVRLDEGQVPAPGPDGVVVEVAACGICGSDLGFIAVGGLGTDIAMGPLAIGHEFAGIVAEVGQNVHGIAPGTRVAVNPDADYIGGGGPTGAMAPFIGLRDATLGRTLFPLPDHVSFEEAALAEPLSVALHGMRITSGKRSDKIAILGAGPIGLCAVAMARHLGMTDIAVVDRVPSRLERARALGATRLIDTSKEDLAEALYAAHGETMWLGSRCAGTDLFIDAAGAAPLLTQAIAAAKFKARIAVIALYKKPVPVDLFRLMANEISMTGSIAIDRAQEFGEALEMIAAREIDLSPMISHHFDFDCFHEAIDVARDADASAKVMLHFKEPA